MDYRVTIRCSNGFPIGKHSIKTNIYDVIDFEGHFIQNNRQLLYRNAWLSGKYQKLKYMNYHVVLKCP